MDRGLDLPDEVLTDVLVRLPVKKLLQLRCISKGWLRLISSSFFKRMHKEYNQLHPKRTPYALLWDEKYDDSRMLDVLSLHIVDILSGELHSEFTIDDCARFDLGISCGSLVCFYDYGATNIRVVNPSTHECIKLPKSKSNFCRNWGIVGIGYLLRTDQYKIVRCSYLPEDDRMDCEILEISDGRKTSHPPCWRSVTNYSNRYQMMHESVRVNGVIYWLVMSMDNKVRWMLAFDLEREESSSLISLPFHDTNVPHPFLVDLGGSLCLATREQYNLDLTTKIWTLKVSETLEWVAQYNISCLNRAIALVPSELGEEEVACIYPCRHSQLTYYSIRGDQARSCIKEFDFDFRSHVLVYFDSFFFLDSE